MPTWGAVLDELLLRENRGPEGQPDFDKVRRKYLAQLHQLTGRAVILYASAFLEKSDAPGNVLSIELGDIQGFMNAVHGIDGTELDLILTSPGGSAEAAESIVSYLRTRFTHIRVFVPVAAMSAATMMALGADEIVMGKHSQLGPIDPQFTIFTPEGPRAAPAFEIRRQFEQAKEECKDPSNLPAWTPILRAYAPGLLAQCVTQRDLAERMVGQWLADHMLAGEENASAKAAEVAKWFADYDRFKSHARRVSRDEAKDLGLKITFLEAHQELQDAVLSVHHACSHTFSGGGAVKIIENHLGKAFVRVRGPRIAVPVPAGPAVPATGERLPGPGMQASRAERRRQR